MEQFPLTILTEKDLFEKVEIEKLYQQEHPTTLFVRKGQANLSVQINKVQLSANTVLILDPKSTYKIHSVSPDFEGRIVVYENDYVQKLGLKLNKLQVFKHFKSHLNNIDYLPEKEHNLLWTEIDLLAELLKNDISLDYKEDIVDHLFSAFIYGLAGALLKQEELGKTTMTRQEEITFEFVKNVFENFRSEKLLQFYADKQNLTIRHLSSVVKSITQKTANQVISEFVMNESKILLTSSKISIQEIANDLQFSDPYSFSHFFKKHSGMSPIQYRTEPN
ncbi:helix-turn-helix domain-containing protein [Kaistella flava (ex Peng et al. 2021)]|uniref:Helix-turn-helix domain-containing protein n=1 Tax=Kaistella flava (ex Peng et al. 2021) TaxID=2038776 RepID=A0A7M2Y828_9FLAO|nr:AraC family transcriptional regulator [Kaistella flava (ex Peng et al. 2021)]QOW09503.1 helix-turn-helix domain-containing protein [Kaistella flava (ex Peng et al. 2021)]